MVDSIVYEIANIGLTLLFVVMAGVIITWLKDKI